MDFDQTLDAKGLTCPLPILKAKKVLSGMSGGQVLQVLATDPHATSDFEAFCKQTGHKLLKADKDPESDLQTIYVERREQ